MASMLWASRALRSSFSRHGAAQPCQRMAVCTERSVTAEDTPAIPGRACSNSDAAHRTQVPTVPGVLDSHAKCCKHAMRQAISRWRLPHRRCTRHGVMAAADAGAGEKESPLSRLLGAGNCVPAWWHGNQPQHLACWPLPASALQKRAVRCTSG